MDFSFVPLEEDEPSAFEGRPIENEEYNPYYRPDQNENPSTQNNNNGTEKYQNVTENDERTFKLNSSFSKTRSISLDSAGGPEYESGHIELTTLESSPSKDSTHSDETAKESEFRTIYNNSNEHGKNKNLAFKFSKNSVHTTKYTWYNFIPKNLYEQFHRYANFFFLVTAILTLIPGITNISPFSSISPLLFVLAVTALKEAFDDIRRAQSDKQINQSKVIALRNGEWKEIQWKEVQTGDMLKIRNNELIPADILLLNSSLQSGVCYIQTSNLDGETNLKVRQALEATTVQLAGSEEEIVRKVANWDGYIECEQPNKDLYNFDGRLYMSGAQFGKRAQPLSLSNNQILYRGCMMKNTDWIIGFAVFTGRDSKLRQNARDPPSKRSTLEKQMNRGLMSLFIFMFVLTIICSIVSVAILNRKWWYLDLDSEINRAALTFFRNFASYLILFSYMIPISLYVSMEIVKLGQTYFLEQDINMYYEKTDTPAKAKTSSLNEELGQIDFIFSDKTGTLTSNEMELLKCSIEGQIYALADESTRTQGNSNSFNANQSFGFQSEQDLSEYQEFNGKEETVGHSRTSKLQLDESTIDIQEFDKATLLQEMSPTAREFFTLLAVCHTVLPEEAPGENGKGPNIVYQASSPDEFALVTRAAQMGFVFKRRTFDTVVISVPKRYFSPKEEQTPTQSRRKSAEREREEDEGIEIASTMSSESNINGGSEDAIELEYKILNMIEFTSNRKRMSVICRTPDGKLVLYCKGADSVILPRLNEEEQKQFESVTDHQLEYFAANGLRTLCCAKAELDESEYNDWNYKFEEANSSIVDRKGQIEIVADEIERNLTLVGCTAIEDKLQDGVPEAISRLRMANLKIWVLTGDKQETAINIGLSCHLLTGINLIVLYRDNPDTPINQDTVKQEIQNAIKQIEIKRANTGEEFGLVIEGETLKWCLDKGEYGIEPLFMDLALQCKTVVCCRVSPSQKRGVVKIVKHYLPQIRTLAIGDGANDVSMIQEAHIGIGILGKEGSQAAMNSDYSVAQFQHLAHLLLVHGRRSYVRTCKLVLYSFYKNAILAMCMFWFTWYSLFSAQNLFDGYSLAGFNVLFASFPILCYAILDQDVKGEQAYWNPKLYEVGQRGNNFSLRLLWGYFCLGIYHSIVIFFGVRNFYGYSIINYSGRATAFWAFGATAFTCIVLVVNAKVALETNYFTWLNWVFIFGCVAFWFLYSILYSSWYTVSTMDYFDTQHLWSSAGFWFLLVILVAICMIPDVSYQYLQRNYFPFPHQIVQEIQREGRIERKRLRKQGIVAKKPSILSVPLDFTVEEATSTERKRTRSHMGYAFAQDDNTARAFSLSLSSFLKKKNMKEHFNKLTGRGKKKEEKPSNSNSKPNVSLII